LGICTMLSAQNVTVQAYVVNNRVYVGEQFRLVVEAKGSGLPNLSTPQMPQMHFTVLGSSRSSSQSISFINGSMTSEKTETFTFSLRGDTAGSFRIPPISVMIEGKEHLTAPIDVTVYESTGQTQQGSTNSRPGGSQQTIPPPPARQETTVDGSEMFLRASVDKTTVYKNEMIVVHYKLYTQSQLQNLSLGAEPSFSGFWKEDLFQADRVTMQREVYDGRQYFTLLLRSIALFPSREGTLTIPQLEVVADIVIPARSFFDWGSTRQLKVSSRPVNVTVNPLPHIDSDRNFIGAVGKYTVSSSISGHQVEAGGSLTYKITISGTGNFNQTISPRFPEVWGVRSFTPQTEDAKNRSETSFSGKRTFIYPITFVESGTITIPEIPITWYDASQRRYFTQMLEAQTVEVAPSAQQTVVIAGAQQTIRMIGSDIQFIVTQLSAKSFVFLYHTYWYWAVIFLLILSLPIHDFYILEQNKQQSDAHYRRSRQAAALMKKYLKEANKYARQNSIEFYDSAYIGISKFLTDKLSLPRGSTAKVIIDSLREHEISENVIGSLQKTFDRLNFIKFSNADISTVNIKADLVTIDDLIQQMINELGKKTKRSNR